MRKIFAILALCCLLFLTAGYHLLYHIRIAEAKQMMKKDLLSAKAEEMTKLVFSKEEKTSLAWEGSDEFQFKGEMYDVLKAEMVNGKLIIWCVVDKKETTLLDDYLKIQKQSSENSSSNSIVKIITLPFLPAMASEVSSLSSAVQKAFPRLLIFFPNTEKSIPTPPPLVC